MEKASSLTLFIFIDAMGWEILERHPNFLKEIAPKRQRLRTVFGYSSACDPSIISGLLPHQHLHWSSFYYAPHSCPYRWVRHLRFLPSVLTDYHKVRHRLSQAIKKIHGFTGYFQIYNVPFAHLPYFDYAEKVRLFAPEGLRRGRNIFDIMQTHGVSYTVDDSAESDPRKFEKLSHQLTEIRPQLAYLLLGQLDAAMHAKGPLGPHVSELLAAYEKRIQALHRHAESLYQEVSLYVFSDHGMHAVNNTFDLQKEIFKLSLQYGKDYVVVYDSTMARFWYLNDRARTQITHCLQQLPCGRILTDQELHSLGTLFPGNIYGETIFLLNSSTLIAPSYMNRKYLPGMHGFHPNDADSYAAVCSKYSLPKDLSSIEQIFWLMLRDTKLPPPQNHDIPDFRWPSPLN